MRVLFSFVGGAGHAEPAVPVARALSGAGHAVAFAGPARHLPALARRGFEVHAVEGGSAPARLPLVAPSQAHEDRVVREHYATHLPRVREAAVLRLYEAWRPDVVVRDEMDFGAAVLTEHSGLPCAVVQVLAAGAFLHPEVLAEPWGALRARHQLAPDPRLRSLSRDVVLSPFPASFRHRDPASSPVHRFSDHPRVLADGGGRAPRCRGRLQRPLVYVTLGTVFPLESGDLFQRVVEAVSALSLDVVVTVGPDVEPRELGPQPRHVQVVSWLPPSMVLARASLVISHGGSGTVSAALAHGLPQLVLAMGADQLHNADRLVSLGLGRLMDPAACAADITEAAAALLGDPQVRANAERMQREMAALPRPRSVVPVLERLVAAQRPGA